MPLTLNTIGKFKRGALASLCADAITELERACLKFPAFPDRLLSEMRPADHIAGQLARARACNEAGEDSSAYSVAAEEVLEFFDAAARGDAAGARAELLQAMAMLLRTYIHLDDYCPGKQAGNAQRSTLNA